MGRRRADGWRSGRRVVVVAVGLGQGAEVGSWDDDGGEDQGEEDEEA